MGGVDWYEGRGNVAVGAGVVAVCHGCRGWSRHEVEFGWFESFGCLGIAGLWRVSRRREVLWVRHDETDLTVDLTDIQC